MQAVDVLRALPLGQVALRPREIGVDVELAVEGFLRRRHTGRVLRRRDESWSVIEIDDRRSN
jgi:hypothetical protein